jgi:sigma-B regulation protein RsbU (phosphoserine phosphatase)
MRRVLVCDDQADVVEALRLLLKGFGYRVDTAYAPHELISRLEQSPDPYSAVVMDMNYTRDTTSGSEGLELVASVRARRPALPIIVMTAWGSVDLAVEAMQRGASDFVQKPWDNAKLLAVVEKQIAKSAASNAYSELEIARSVQQGLFPGGGGEIAGAAAFDGLCIPAREIGGDYYDFLPFPGGKLGLVLADVSGKGVPAALLMANLQALFRSQQVPDVRAILRNVNGHFFRSTSPSHYATAFFAIYDPSTRLLTYANCGHPSALVMPSGRMLDTTATVIGILGERAFDVDVETITLAPGDTVLVVSDGITEAGIDNGEEFGAARVERLLRAWQAMPLAELLSAIARAAEEYSDGDHGDDMTLLGLRVLA